ncbi:MAG: hypothetical protein NVS2B8_00050 [Vulcanimicrobiaceae bacterium]
MIVGARARRFIWLVALGVMFAITLSAASARTYNHGKTVWFGDTTIAAGDDVRGNLDVVFGNVTCEDGAVIEGNVRTFFASFEQRDGCSIGGSVSDAFGSGAVDAVVPWIARSNDEVVVQNRGFLKKLAWDVVVVFAFLLFPLRVRIALERVEMHPGSSAAAGAVALVAAVPIAILLVLSILGIPLVPLEIAALFAALWIGHAAVALLIGRRVHELVRPHTTPSPLGALLLGLVVVTAAQTLPVVGWAVTALVVLVGLGAAILAFVRETAFRSFGTSAAPRGGLPQVTPPR